jgi:hypothetical protein
MLGITSIRRHLGDWISVRVQTVRTPPRLTITITFGELPEGWARSRSHARTWAGLLGLACISPFVALIAATLLKSAGLNTPYVWLSTSSIAILAATISLFFGIPIAIAVNLWRIGRAGLHRRDGGLEGLVALEFAPLHLLVVLIALVIGVAFVGHLAADSYACFNGVHTAC